MRTPYTQRGMTLWGWLYVLATLGVIFLVGIKSAPIYLTNFEIQSVLDWAATQEKLQQASERQIQERIQRRFSSGYVDVISGHDVAVEHTADGRRLSVSYDQSVHLFSNISLHFEFDDTALMTNAAP